MSFNDRSETEVALVALLHLIRLMGAELVAGQHRDNVELLVKAIETKLRAAKFPADMPDQDIAKGLDLAQQLLRPIWDAWFRLALAYDASGDRRRARWATRQAIKLSRA